MILLIDDIDGNSKLTEYSPWKSRALTIESATSLIETSSSSPTIIIKKHLLINMTQKP
jgi:hypothetical protein